MEKKKSPRFGWLPVIPVLLCLLIAAMNILLDPYGAFGDPILHWWSYNETANPRVAKITYIEQHRELDSFLVGTSESGGFPVAVLNDYLDASFYNCFFQDADMETNERLCNYLLNRGGVKNLVLNLSPRLAVSFAEPGQPDSHYKVSGESALGFYARYALKDPRLGLEKWNLRKTDPFLPQDYRIYDAETGAFDEIRRDAEPIGDLDAYLAKEAYQVFSHCPADPLRLDAIDEVAAAVGRIRQLAREQGVNLIVTCQPLYHETLNRYDPAEIQAFRTALAEVTDYWDFTLSSVSFDARYFYDDAAFRPDVGRMALARIFGDDGVYIPESFGVFIPRGSTPEPLTALAPDPADYTAKVPILMYHNLVTADEMNAGCDTPDWFREQMAALKTGGYTPIDLNQLRAYVLEGAGLPEKPVIITFDDGYLDNYKLAYPVLKEYGFRAVMFVIGVSVGKDTYKDTGVPMIPHFSLEQAAEMQDSGLISIGSHGYNIHEVKGRDPAPIRPGIKPREGETEAEYVAFVRGDCAMQAELLGYNPGILSYPESKFVELSEILLRECGIWATITTAYKNNVIVQGLEQTLRQLGRYNVNSKYSGADLLQMLETGIDPHA